MKQTNITKWFIFAAILLYVPGIAQNESILFQEWAVFKGTQNMFHHSKTITDSNRNVYVIGSSINPNGDYDIMVVKYNRMGVLLWDDNINGSANGDDIGTDLILDSNENLIITGSVVNTGTTHDLVEIKNDEEVIFTDKLIKQ